MKLVDRRRGDDYLHDVGTYKVNSRNIGDGYK